MKAAGKNVYDERSDKRRQLRSSKQREQKRMEDLQENLLLTSKKKKKKKDQQKDAIKSGLKLMPNAKRDLVTGKANVTLLTLDGEETR
jgi:hypothetical protein